MTTLEIILLITGLLFIIISFLLSERFTGKKNTSLDKEEVRDLLLEEIETVKNKLDLNLEETVDTTLDKTYRDLEKVSNEKIMAVSEYSDSVLEEIQKNHKEVIFLYNMLTDKEEKLKGAVAKAEKAKIEVNSLIQKTEQKVNTNKTDMSPENEKEKQSGNDTSLSKEIEGKKTPEIKVINHNQKIMELYEQGLSKTDIAKKLGLGLGEVRLVLDLFKGDEK